MTTSKVIVNNLKKKDVSSVLTDIKAFLRTDEDGKAAEIYSILRSSYHFLKDFENSVPSPKGLTEIVEVISCIEDCVTFVKEKCKIDESLNQQFITILFHIISVCLKLGKHEDSLSLASDVQKEFLKDYKATDDKNNYSRFLSAVFWNEALSVEKKSLSNNYDICFKLRQQCVKFTLIDNNLPLAKTYTCMTIIKYCYNNNDSDSNKIVCFLQNVWLHLSSVSESYNHLIFLYELLYSLLESIVNSCKERSLLELLLSLTLDLSEKVQRSNGTKDEINTFKSCLEVSMYSIQIFLLKESIKVSTSQISKYSKLFKDQNSNLASQTCAYFYLSLVRALNSFESENLESYLKPNLAFCVTMTLHFLHIFPKLKLEGHSAFNTNSDITLAWAALRVIYMLIKNETGSEDQQNLFKEAKNFIEASFMKIKTNFRNAEFEAKLSSYAKTIGNIGFSAYNSALYSKSIFFLETGLKYAIFDEAETKKKYKWKEILVYCYLLSGNHKMALQYVALLMVHYKDKTKECFELWRKVKGSALKNKDTAVSSCTISDIATEMRLKLSKEEDISLLVEEFSGCKLERCSSEEEMLNIVKRLMDLQCSGIKWAHVILVTISMGIARSRKISSLLNKSPLDMCLEIVNTFETFVSENPTNNEVKVQLSISYVWLFLIKLMLLHSVATKEGSNYSKPKSEGEDENESDIQPTIPLLTYLVEAETLKCLEKALNIWTSISSDSKSSWSELSVAVKHWDLLTLIQAAGEFFATSASDVLEIKSWVLLRTVAVAVKDKEFELHSTIAMINFFVKMGYLDMASHLLAITDISVFNAEEYNMLKLKFHLAESNFLLHKGKFDDGLILLRKVLDNNIFEKSYKSVKMLQIQAMLLQTKYFMIPPSGFSDAGNIDYLSVNSATSCAMECAGAAKRLLRILTEKVSTEGCTDWITLRTETVKYLLTAYFLLAEHYKQIGDPRFAKCFLLEGLKVAEENLLTYWSSKMLILLGQVDLICKDLNDCTVKLNCLKYILDENSKENADMLLQKAFDNTEIPESTDESEDYILPIENRLKLQRAFKQNFINTEVHSSPIPLKYETNSKFEVKSIPYTGHNTFYVYLIKLEMWSLSCMQLVAEDKHGLAEMQFSKLVKKCELMKSTKLVKVINILKSSNINWGKESLNRLPSLSEKELTANTLYRLSILHFAKGDFKSTKSCIDSAFKILNDSSNYGKCLHSITYGLLKYQQIVACLKNLIQIKPDFCLELALCPSVDIKGIATKRILKDSSILNVTPTKSIPKIKISPCAKKRITKAPKKKDVLPAHLKKDIENSAKSNEFPSLIFSSSDDEFLSKTPVAPKKPSKKLFSSSTKGSENESNPYNLFKSKNSGLNINASSDIWKFPDFATPKANNSSKSHQAAMMGERKTRQGLRNTRSDNKSSSNLLDPQTVKRSTRSRSSKRSELQAADSIDENKTWANSVSEERRVSIEHYRGTSKSLLRKVVLEDIDVEEDVFLPSSSENVPKSGMQLNTLATENQTSILEKLCEDLTSMDIQEKSKAIVKHKVPEEKLAEFINELDEIRLLVQHNAPYPLYVNLCKLLAVLIMHKNEGSPTLYDSAFLLSETFASVLRQLYLGQFYVLKENKSSDVTQFEFSKFLKRKNADVVNQMKSLLNVIPPDFTVVQITPLFEKEVDKSSLKSNVSKLIICRYHNGSQPLVMSLNCTASEMCTTSIVSDFSNILAESTLIMKSSDDRKKWWSTRTTLDGRLKSLVKNMEDFWLGSWKGLLLSSATDEKRKKSIKKIVDSLCKVAEPTNKTLLEVLLDSASYLSSEQLSAAICHLWKCKPFDSIFSQLWNCINEAKALELPDSKRNPLVLILDKDLQALPWESLPILNDVPVSRMPSLNIMTSKLSMLETKSVLQNGLDCNNTYYILNPGGDLKYSQAYFQPIFEKIKSWEGIIGKPPTAEECALALKNRDLFVYCGHGSGRQYLEGKTVDKMPCSASAILMGCSSGRLRQYEKQLEAYGIPLTYLMNGSPCVVGNLWDVTDKDIDRFTDKLFELFVPSYKEEQKTTNVATAVSDARSACKMRYLVGCAPVIYGLPVFAKK